MGVNIIPSRIRRFFTRHILKLPRIKKINTDSINEDIDIHTVCTGAIPAIQVLSITQTSEGYVVEEGTKVRMWSIVHLRNKDGGVCKIVTFDKD